MKISAEITIWASLLLSFVASCDKSSILEDVGLADPAPDPPINIEVLCDHSAESTCDADTLRKTADVAFAAIFDRPRSTVRFWLLGKETARTRKVISIEVPGTFDVRPGKEKRRERWTSEAVDRVADAFDFTQPRPRFSPLFESIEKIARDGSEKTKRIFVIISDLREYSDLADLECRPPSEKILSRRLDGRDVLLPQSLHSEKFYFVEATSTPLSRCTGSLKRDHWVHDFWTSRLTNAGAPTVVISAGPLSAELLSNDETKEVKNVL